MTKEKISGIYKILNIINNKFYIGSSYNIDIRWNDHKRELRNNRHTNNRLQNAWNKYGEKAFEFSIIEKVSRKNLTKREQFWFNKLKPYEKEIGYNISFIAGRPPSEKRICYM